MEEKEGKNSRWIFIIIVIVVLGLLSFVIATVISYFIEPGSSIAAPELGSGNVALIPVKGFISTESESSLFGTRAMDSSKIVGFIEAADSSPGIKAIMLEIDSPGGAPVASQEIVNAVKAAKKFTVALIREQATSGAYWVASAADQIVLSEISLTGSIGVMGSYLEFTGLLDRYGVYYERMVGGDYKDMGSPYRNITSEERELFQGLIDDLHDFFVEDVAESRKLTQRQKQEISTARIVLGREAVDLGLADTIGGRKEALELIEARLNITPKLVEFKEKRTILDLLSEVSHSSSYQVGRGIGSRLVESPAFAARSVLLT